MQRFIAALCAAFALMCAPAAAQSLLSPSEFRDAAIAVIHARAPDIRVEVRDELGIAVQRAGDKGLDSTVNFDAAYGEYRRAPETLADILDRWARFATQDPEQVQYVERVVSVLRPRESIAGFTATLREHGQDSPLVWRPFAGDLVEIIVFDGAESMQYATEATLADVGLSPDAAWEAAPRNLPTRLGEVEIAGVEGADGLVFITGGNGLAPSTLIDGAMCASEDGVRPIFLVVERNGYIVGDDADADSRRQFVDVFRAIQRNGDAMSFTPLGCRDGRVVEITLAE